MPLPSPEQLRADLAAFDAEHARRTGSSLAELLADIPGLLDTIAPGDHEQALTMLGTCALAAVTRSADRLQYGVRYSDGSVAGRTFIVDDADQAEGQAVDLRLQQRARQAPENAEAVGRPVMPWTPLRDAIGGTGL